MEGEGEPPWEWIVSRVCEEFGCLPSDAVRELMDDPAGLALDVMELRAYARAKEALDSAKKAGDEPTGPMADMVWEVMSELLKRRKRG